MKTKSPRLLRSRNRLIAYGILSIGMIVFALLGKATEVYICFGIMIFVAVFLSE